MDGEYISGGSVYGPEGNWLRYAPESAPLDYPPATPGAWLLDLKWSNPGQSWWNYDVKGATAFKARSPSGQVEHLVRLDDGSVMVELPPDTMPAGSVTDSGNDILGKLVQLAVPLIITGGAAQGFVSLPAAGADPAPSFWDRLSSSVSDFVGPVQPGAMPSPVTLPASPVPEFLMPAAVAPAELSLMPAAVLPVESSLGLPGGGPLLDVFRGSIDFPVMPPAVAPGSLAPASSAGSLLDRLAGSASTSVAKAAAGVLAGSLASGLSPSSGQAVQAPQAADTGGSGLLLIGALIVGAFALGGAG